MHLEQVLPHVLLFAERADNMASLHHAREIVLKTGVSTLPTVSRLTVIGTMPSPAFQQPVVGLKPTMPVMPAGILHEPPAYQSQEFSR